MRLRVKLRMKPLVSSLTWRPPEERMQAAHADEEAHWILASFPPAAATSAFDYVVRRTLTVGFANL
ncbi:hypothetical protein Mapa_007791 [Marchantia paleacea]|nr:hypothetical protein Mapa_007791 [Marchantia paleacea]